MFMASVVRLRPDDIAEPVSNVIVVSGDAPRVMQGGFLVDPLLLTDLLMIDDKKFITLQKWSPTVRDIGCPQETATDDQPIINSCDHGCGSTVMESCRYCGVTFCEACQRQGYRYQFDCVCGQRCVLNIEEDHRCIVTATASLQDRALSLVCKDATRQRVRTARSHHAPKCKSMIPKYGVGKMNVGTPSWEPICVLTPTTANIKRTRRPTTPKLYSTS